MSVEDSESRRFEPKVGLRFSQADIGPTSAPDCFFGLFQKLGTFFFSQRAHRKRVLNKFGGYL